MSDPAPPPAAPAVSAVPTFAAHSRPGDFLQGLVLPFAATGLIFRSKKLFALSALSGLVTAASLVGLLALLVRFTSPLLAWVWPKPEAALLIGLWYAVLTVTFLILLAVGALTVPTVLLAPLQDPLSEATEDLCGGNDAPDLPLVESAGRTARSIGHTLLRVAFLLGGHLLLFALNLIPGAGAVLWSVCATLWTMIWSAAEHLDAPMSRHLYPFRALRQVLWSRLPLCLGFGAAVYAMLWIPILNFFFIPAAVVGGTLLFRGLRACGALPRP